MKKLKDIIKEEITIPVEIGDTIYVGRFKNKAIVVKSIEYDEYGMPVINGRKGTTFRMNKTKKENKLYESLKRMDMIKILDKNNVDVEPKVGGYSAFIYATDKQVKDIYNKWIRDGKKKNAKYQLRR